MTWFVVLGLVSLGPREGVDGPWIEGTVWHWRAQSMTLTIQPTSVPERLTIVVAQPQSEERQHVSLATMPTGYSSKTQLDVLGVNRLFQVRVHTRRNQEVSLHFRYHIATRERRLDLDHFPRGTISRDEKVLAFAKPGPSTGADDEELQAEGQLLSKTDNALDIARRAYESTIDRLTYDGSRDFRGASRAWRDKAGHCADYAAVFVALCRHAHLPARVVAGYRGTEAHVWAEFHLAEAGWVPCDPSKADGVQEAREENFARISADYIAISRDTDLDLEIEGLHSVPALQEYAYRYEGPEEPKLHWIFHEPESLPNNGTLNNIGKTDGKDSDDSFRQWPRQQPAQSQGSQPKP